MVTCVCRAEDGSGQQKKNEVAKALVWLFERKVVSLLSVKAKFAGEKL